MKKPSKIKIVSAKKAWLLLPGFVSTTLFGIVYCKLKSMADTINKTDKIDSKLESHETIHVRQAESTHDSWLLFYLKYIWQWILNLPLIFVDVYAPYKFMPFELEAYANQDNWDYCLDKCENWKVYKKLTLKQKRQFAKDYYKQRIKPYFTSFIRNNINPVLGL